MVAPHYNIIQRIESLGIAAGTVALAIASVFGVEEALPLGHFGGYELCETIVDISELLGEGGASCIVPLPVPFTPRDRRAS